MALYVAGYSGHRIHGGDDKDLLAMVRVGATKEWWEGHRALPPKFGSYLGLESVASSAG